MSQSAGLNQRQDPYKNYKFRLIFNNRTYSGGIRTGLVPPPGLVDYRPGGNPSTATRQPGRSKYEPITLNRGVTQDPSFSNWANQASSQGKYPPIPVDRGVTRNASFSSWASQVLSMGSSLGSEVSLANFRKNVLLEFYNEAGQLVVTYRLNGNQVSETQSKAPGRLPALSPPGRSWNLARAIGCNF